MAVCVFRTWARSPSVPAGDTTVFDGVRLLVQSPDAFAVDAMGDADRLAADLDGLPAG